MLTQTQRNILAQIQSLYGKQMFSRAFSVLRNREDAEDAVQNSYIKIAQNLDRIDTDLNSERNRLYVTVIAYHAAIDVKRTSKKNLHLVTRSEQDFLSVSKNQMAFDELIFQSDAVTALLREVYSFDKQAAKVYFYKHFLGFSHAEIAEFFDISIARSQKLVHKAQKHIRNSDIGKSIHKWITMVFILILAALVLAACALLLRYIKTYYEQKTGYQVTNYGEMSVTDFDVGYVVDGYNLVDTLSSATFAMHVYENAESQMYTVTIYTDTEVYLFLDNEDGELTTLTVNGNPCEIYTFEKKDAIAVLFLPNATVEIVGPLSKDDLIRIMQSITLTIGRNQNEKAAQLYNGTCAYIDSAVIGACTCTRNSSHRRTH